MSTDSCHIYHNSRNNNQKVRPTFYTGERTLLPSRIVHVKLSSRSLNTVLQIVNNTLPPNNTTIIISHQLILPFSFHIALFTINNFVYPDCSRFLLVFLCYLHTWHRSIQLRVISIDSVCDLQNVITRNMTRFVLRLVLDNTSSWCQTSSCRIDSTKLDTLITASFLDKGNKTRY